MRRFIYIVGVVSLLCMQGGSVSSHEQPILRQAQHESYNSKIDPMLKIFAGHRGPSYSSAAKAFGIKAQGDQMMAEVLIKTVSQEFHGSFTGVSQEFHRSFIGVPEEFQGSSTGISAVQDVGGVVNSRIGDILTATVPLFAISELAASEDIIYIEAARPLRSKMNYARGVTRVDEVQDGTGTSTAYTGSGVIVGTVDSGIDCDHADFQDGSGNTRILAYWDQTTTSDTTGVTEIENSTGTEYTGTELTDGTCVGSPDASNGIGHGTHVAGIAAGSNGTYKGVAPDANIIAVKLNEPSILSGTYSGYITTLTTNVVDAVNYIFKKAQTLQKPAVVNLSIGTSLGAHDGTSLFEAALDALLVESGSTEKEGRAIVSASGNENAAVLDHDNAGGIHAAISVSSGSPKGFEFLMTSILDSGYATDPVAGVGGIYADVWLTSGSNCTIGINAFNTAANKTLRKEMDAVSKGSSGEATDGTVTMTLDFTEESNTLNGKQHAIGLVTASTGSRLSGYTFDLVFTGTCTGDAWLYYDSVSYNVFTKDRTTNSPAGYTYADGDSDKTMTIPATANKVIAVGSFLDRDEWTNSAGAQVSEVSVTGGTVSGISTFSSLGPTADSRTKPELAAPGEPIISTLASNISSSSKADGTHQMLAGSSMATPHVAGTVALMLEKNGCLKPAQTKASLTGTTDTDTYTGTSLPDNTWGYGKLDAVAAVNNVTASSCVPDNPSEESDDDTGGDAGGDSGGTTASASGGCGSTISSGGGDAKTFHAMLILLPCFVLLVYRKTKARLR